jgi:ribosomal subunit interface protein
MNYNIKGTSVQISDELRIYVEKKLEHTDKFLGDDTTAHADVELEHSPLRDGEQYRAEFTVSAAGEVYRAERWGITLHAAVDIAIDELVKELRRTKKKHLRLIRHGAAMAKDILRGLRRKS